MPVKKRIGIMEDDSVLCRELQVLLEGAGYETVIADCQRQELADILRGIGNMGADLLLMDINLPGLNGEEILRHLRKESKVPVIMVTSRMAEADEVLSMSYGADDYITKPYNPTILLLRIAAILRRTEKCGMDLTYHGLTVSPAKGLLSDGEKELVLTKNEMIIFEQLLTGQGNIVTRDVLMTALWDNEEYVNDNALTVNISRLRGKLADIGFPDAIETRKKQGYVLRGEYSCK